MSQNVSRITDKSSSYSIRQTANEESWKLQYDIYKHLTTLSTGSILLLITFLEKLFNKPIWKGLVVVALCCLILSILLSFIVMNLMASQVRDMEVDQRFVKRNLTVIILAISMFLLGIISLAAFAIKNLMSVGVIPAS